MVRVVILHVLLFAVPFLLYAAHLWRRGLRPDDPISWKGAPVIWLAVIGGVLVAVSLTALGTLTGASGGRYVPAHIEDGRLVPGRFE